MLHYIRKAKPTLDENLNASNLIRIPILETATYLNLMANVIFVARKVTRNAIVGIIIETKIGTQSTGEV
jgi:hypothetical protein